MIRERQLDVYVVAMELARELHEPLKAVGSRVLQDQARRAMMSIVLNVSEGMGKLGSTRREQARFYAMARGSTFELFGCLSLADAWEWLAPGVLASAEVKLDRISAMLSRLIARAG